MLHSGCFARRAAAAQTLLAPYANYFHERMHAPPRTRISCCPTQHPASRLASHPHTPISLSKSASVPSGALAISSSFLFYAHSRYIRFSTRPLPPSPTPYAAATLFRRHPRPRLRSRARRCHPRHHRPCRRHTFLTSSPDQILARPPAAIRPLSNPTTRLPDRRSMTAEPSIVRPLTAQPLLFNRLTTIRCTQAPGHP